MTSTDRGRPATHHTLVQVLVYNFQYQRVPDYKYQFAVIILSSEKVIKFRVRDPDSNGVICIPTRLTDNRYSIFPPDSQVYNYITARPNGRLGYLHAEAQLMVKFSILLQSFNLSNRHSHKSVVLFTWLLPCWHCAKRITSTLSGNSLKVILSYVSKMQNVSEEEERSIVAYLDGAGLRVIHEIYKKRLPPAGQT